jgi:ribosomal protein S4
MNFIKKNTSYKKKNFEKKFTNSKNWNKWSKKTFFGQKYLTGKQTWAKKVTKFTPKNYAKKRINYPRKKYIRFVYYSKKILRWKKIFVRRYHRRLGLHVKMNLKYQWRYFWRRKKIKKRLRFWHNFIFVLKKQNPINVLKFNRKKKWVGPRKRRAIKFLPKRLPKRKLSVRARDTFKKKIYFKKFLIKYYNFRKVYQLKNIYRWSKKIPGNNIINFFLSLESQLGSVCVRMHFFWTLKSARTWISLGLVYVNGKLIKFPRHVIKIGDLVSILIYKLIWSWAYDFWFGSWRRRKLNRYLNGSELSYKCASAIIFYLPYKIEDIKIMLKKRRKHWLKTRVFSFLVNSFY